MAGPGSPIQFQSSTDNSLRVSKFTSLAEEHTQGILGRRVVARTQINCRLEGTLGLLVPAQLHVRHAHVIVSLIIVRKCCSGLRKARQTKIGRASCRERVEEWVGAESFNG